MNISPSYIAVTEEFTFPGTPDVGTISVSVFYDYGDTIVPPSVPVLTSGTTYSVTIIDDLLGSAGLYKIRWSCDISGAAFYAYTEFTVEDPYVSSSDFFSEFPDFDVPEHTSRFASVEKMSRRVIDFYTGQNFQCIKGKTRKYHGNGRSKIYLEERLNHFSSVFVNDSDYTAEVTLDHRSKYYIDMLEGYSYSDSRIDDVVKSKFPNNTTVSITGDWGWLSVPNQVVEASKLLIADLLDDTRREHHRYGIERLEQGNNRVQFAENSYSSTGNIDVDVLLMDFVHWTIDYVY